MTKNAVFTEYVNVFFKILIHISNSVNCYIKIKPAIKAGGCSKTVYTKTARLIWPKPYSPTSVSL